jgi:CBS domain-containing protein
MKVADLLKDKGKSVITITPDEPVFTAMGKLIDNQIGSLVVIDAEKKLVGIISERDIMRAAYSDLEMLKSKKVSQLMSTNIIIGIPEDDIDYIMGIMTQNRIRHLPIVTKDGIVGIISIGDIVKYQLEEFQVKNRYLEEYMYGQTL